jgi:hypothetical protein
MRKEIDKKLSRMEERETKRRWNKEMRIGKERKIRYDE